MTGERFAITMALMLMGAHVAAAETVTIATPLAGPAAATFISLEKGYFREAGVEVKIEQVDSLTRAMALVATNQIQIAQGAINAGVFNSVAQGLPVVMTLGTGATPVYHNLVLRRGLRGEVKSPADLRGRNISVTGPGSGSVYEVAGILGSFGVRLSEVNLKSLAFPQVRASLANGSLDAALTYSPFTESLVDDNLADAWIDPEDHLKSLPMTSLTFVSSLDWIGGNRELANKVFIALARGGRDYCQAYHHGPNRGEALDIMIRAGIGDDRGKLDKMLWQARDPDGFFNRESVLDMQRFFMREGYVEKEAPYEKLVDSRFAEEARRALGPFEVINKASALKGCR